MSAALQEEEIAGEAERGIAGAQASPRQSGEVYVPLGDADEDSRPPSSSADREAECEKARRWLQPGLCIATLFHLLGMSGDLLPREHPGVDCVGEEQHGFHFGWAVRRQIL